MQYEPLSYVVEYEIGALAIFLVVMFRFFRSKRFPNQKNRIFACILWLSLLDIVLDVVTAEIIMNVFKVPVIITSLANTLFYSITVLMLVSMMFFALAMTGFIGRERFWRIMPLCIPAAFVIVMLALNPFNDLFFYVDPELGYVHGSMFYSAFVVCGIYLLITAGIIVLSRKKLQRSEMVQVIFFLTIVTGTTLVQFFNPELLVTGVGIALAVTLMYFTLQNPDSMRDLTTGAFTYEAMLTFLRDQTSERVRVQLVAVKINNMSRINELLGIESGSRLLRIVSEFLSTAAPDTWVFRMRGSYLAAITRKPESYRLLSAQVKERIGKAWIIDELEVFVQAKVCCLATNELVDVPASCEDLVDYLEIAFQNILDNGERIQITEPSKQLLDTVKRTRDVEAALRKAIETEQGLELYFQPLWSVKLERFNSAEVLLRFNDPVLGRVSPSEFVPIAEKNGLVTAMDELVVRKACRFVQENANLRQLGLHSLDINLSALEFMYMRLPKLLESIIEEHQVDPSFICFEITETAATKSFELLRETMVKIKEIGCSFALDDFGVGYANISQVFRLPFSVVKLDQSLLHGPLVLLAKITEVFEQMNCVTVIEGVETAEQYALSKQIGVDKVQGFYFARPMNGEQLIEFLNREDSRLEA